MVSHSHLPLLATSLSCHCVSDNFDGDSHGHWCGSSLLSLHSGHLVFLCIPSCLELGSFISVFPQLLTYVVVSLDSFWVPHWAPKLCHASCLYHASHSYWQLAFQLLISYSITWCMGSHSKSRPRHQKSSLNTGRFSLDFVVDSSTQKCNKITNEEKDP